MECYSNNDAYNLPQKNPVCRHSSNSMLLLTKSLCHPTCTNHHPKPTHSQVTGMGHFWGGINRFFKNLLEDRKSTPLNRGACAGSSLPKVYFVSTYAVVSLSLLGSSAGQLFHRAVCRVFYGHSTLTHLSFHTRLVFWLRLLHRTVYHYRIHRKTKLITANILISLLFFCLLKIGGNTVFFLFFKVTW